MLGGEARQLTRPIFIPQQPLFTKIVSSVKKLREASLRGTHEDQ